MASLAVRGINPTVVKDQVGRLTFTSTIAEAIQHVLEVRPRYGVYNVTNAGEPTTWYDIARRVFELAGDDVDRVAPTTTSDYFAHATEPVAPRPTSSRLSLTRIRECGFLPGDANRYLASWLSTAHAPASSLDPSDERML